MIITRTPYRISFFGGGTDYPSWYEQHGGQVLATTIDKYIYISVRYLFPFFPHRIRLVYAKEELGDTVDDLTHPTAREALKLLGLHQDLEIHYDGDLPARSGMGSSSAFTVGLLNALYAYGGRVVSAHQLARDAIDIEQTRVGDTVGSQDQISAAYGGFNRIQFLTNGEIIVRPVPVDKDRLILFSEYLMLFFTGESRTASDIASSYVSQLESKREHLSNLNSMVDTAIDILCGVGDIEIFGNLLHEGWIEKRALSALISTDAINYLYETARNAGALGGKVLGAGGGGMFLLFAPPDAHAAVKNALSDFLHVPFQLEPFGSQVILGNHGSPH
jgi:D-glycero-alpha-D-manno-heptose-7-phosphate kinase